MSCLSHRPSEPVNQRIILQIDGFQISYGKFTFSLGLLDESPDIDRVIGPEANQAPAKK